MCQGTAIAPLPCTPVLSLPPHSLSLLLAPQCRAIVPYGFTVESLPVNFTVLEIIEAKETGPEASSSQQLAPPSPKLADDMVWVEKPRGPWETREYIY